MTSRKNGLERDTLKTNCRKSEMPAWLKSLILRQIDSVEIDKQTDEAGKLKVPIMHIIGRQEE